jgi:hypothetical protein
MSQLPALSIAVTVNLFLSTSISVVMMRPLRGVLNQLCSFLPCSESNSRRSIPACGGSIAVTHGSCGGA